MDITPPRILFALAFLLVVLLGASYELRTWFRETDARQRTTYATCPNFDSVYVHDTHYDQTKRDTIPVRVLHVPCGDSTSGK